MSTTSPDTTPSTATTDTATAPADSGTTAMGSQPMTNQGGKVKQTRRRQRLSCVECTKRRQKCDRQFPCGLCTTRGIPHLCRWEPIVVRPTPQRPPVIPTSAEHATIEALSARIAALEQALLAKSRQGAAQADNQSSSPSSLSPSLSPESTFTQLSANTPPADSPVATTDATSKAPSQPVETGPRALLDFNVQVAAVALAQLSLAPRTEYVGGGTVLCALHKLGDPESFRFPYPATSLTSPINAATIPLTFGHSDGSAHPLVSPIRDLVLKLPPRPHTEALLRTFFIERNWQFGISERWFRAAMNKMWAHLDVRCTPACRTPDGGCPACKEEVNPHWLCFLFSVLALTPATGQTAKNTAIYFMAATNARRLVDDILLASPEYSTSEGAVHGGVLSCIAAVFQAMYLADRGRVSEAWKLIGSAVRSAQALGMHRDPSWGKWEKMHSIEIELRVMGWWSLMIADRVYSFILGRPAMAPKGTFDVFAMPNDAHGDGSLNEHALFLRPFISLSELIGEATEKCLGIHAPPYATILEMDRRFQEWEAQLPLKLRWRKSSAPGSPVIYEHTPLPTPIDTSDDPPCPERKYAYQRNTLAGWYLCALMNIHRPYLMHSPPILPPPGTTFEPGMRLMLNPSRERCIEIAIELTRVMTSFHDEALAWPNPGGLNAGTVAYWIFDGAVALAGALSQVPPHPQSSECLALMDKAMRVLKELADAMGGAGDGQGEMARRGIVILKALRRAGGWDMSDEEKGELVLLQDMLNQHRKQQSRQNNQPLQPQQNAGPTNVLAAQVPISQNMGFTTTPPSFGSQQGINYPNFGPQGGATTASACIPFLNSFPYGSSNANIFNSGNQPISSPTAPSSFSASFLPNSDMPFTSLSNPSPFGAGASRLTQSMVMPFDILQGVQPNIQETTQFDLDWARLAGMESWYSTGAA